MLAISVLLTAFAIKANTAYGVKSIIIPVNLKITAAAESIKLKNGFAFSPSPLSSNCKIANPKRTEKIIIGTTFASAAFPKTLSGKKFTKVSANVGTSLAFASAATVNELPCPILNATPKIKPTSEPKTLCKLKIPIVFDPIFFIFSILSKDTTVPTIDVNNNGITIANNKLAYIDPNTFTYSVFPLKINPTIIPRIAATIVLVPKFIFFLAMNINKANNTKVTANATNFI